MEVESMRESINVVQVPPLHIFLDTETTGLGHTDWHEVREDAVIEIGIAYRDTGGIQSISWLCMPDSKYFQEGRAEYALSVSGISMEELKHSQGDILVSKWAREYINNLGDIVLHSYNISFDRPFLEKYPWNFTYKWGEDPMKMADKIMKLGKYPKLWEAMEKFKISRKGNPHRAGSDAIAALEVYEACMQHQAGEM